MKAPMVEYALAYALKGWAVFPLSPGMKIPIKGTNGFKDASKNEKVIRKMWAECPDANIGIATGKISGIFVVDVDVKNEVRGDETLKDLEDKNGKLPRTPIVITPSRGLHYYFAYPSGSEIGCSQGKIGRGIDVRGDGGYVVAYPSVVDGKTYEWEASSHIDDVEPANMKLSWVIDAMIVKERKEPFKLPAGDIPKGEQDRSMLKLAASLRMRNFDKAQVEGAIKEALKKCPQDPRDPFTQADIDRWITSAFKLQPMPPLDVKYTKTGSVPLKTFKNAIFYLETTEDLNTLFRFNAFHHISEITRRPPWGQLGEYPRPVDESDYVNLKAYLIHIYDVEFNIKTLEEAVLYHSKKYEYDPVKNYLTALKWDGVPRIKTWLTTYLGVSQSVYSDFVGEMTLVAACARIDKPGAKYDYMLILEGSQDIGKSLAVETLGSPFYREISLTERSNEIIEKMQGAWVIEVAELAVFKKKDIESLKAFITSSTDVERLKYGRRSIRFPRRNIFIGTINPDNCGYLSDTTGNRRFLPVSCGKEIDLSSLQRDKDQIWAEAWQSYLKKFPLFIEKDSEIAKIAFHEQVLRQSKDEWQDLIKHFVEEKDRVRSSDIWVDCLKGNQSHFDRIKQIRIADCLKRLGWTAKVFRLNGKLYSGFVHVDKFRDENEATPWFRKEEEAE